MKLIKLLAAYALMVAPLAQANEAVTLIDSVNAELAAAGANVQIGMVEWITDAESEEMGQIMLFKDVGNKQLGFDFVPGDPRRGGRTNITTRTDDTEPSMDAVDTFGAIERAIVPKSRSKHYRVRPDSWTDISTRTIATLGELRRVAEEGTSLYPDTGDPRGLRFRKMQDYYWFMEREMQHLEPGFAGELCRRDKTDREIRGGDRVRP